ncbi:MAG: type sorting protein, partial [Paenibacillus sp.]|nr:type sorting protein [Paenibacillus sp.]
MLSSIYRHVFAFFVFAAIIVSFPAVLKAQVLPYIESVTSPQPDGVYGKGATIQLHVKFNWIVTVTGSPTISLNSGGTATYNASASTLNTLVFDYVPLDGHSSSGLDWSVGNALSLNGGTVTSAIYGLAKVTTEIPALAANSNIVIDTTPPSGSTFTINNGDLATNNANVSVSFQYDDDYSVSGAVSLSTDGQTWSFWQSTASTGSLTLSGTNGEKTIYAKFRDSVGNETEPISKSINLDTTPPTGTIVVSDGKLATKEGYPFSLTITASDNLSSFSDIQVRFSDFFHGPGPWQPVSSSMTYSNNYGGGFAYVYAQFKDQAGNISSTVTDTIEVDPYPASG